MSEYITDKSEMKFESIDALKTVGSVLDEVDMASNNTQRTIVDSPIKEVLTGAAGVGVGGAIGFAGLYLGGSVVGLSAAGITSGLAAAGALIGGGMVAGIAVLAAPAVVLGAGGVALASKANNKKLQEAKSAVYKEALKKQNDIIELLEKERNAGSERLDYLNSLNILLKAAIKDLQHDLGI